MSKYTHEKILRVLKSPWFTIAIIGLVVFFILADIYDLPAFLGYEIQAHHAVIVAAATQGGKYLLQYLMKKGKLPQSSKDDHIKEGVTKFLQKFKKNQGKLLDGLDAKGVDNKVVVNLKNQLVRVEDKLLATFEHHLSPETREKIRAGLVKLDDKLLAKVVPAHGKKLDAIVADVKKLQAMVKKKGGASTAVLTSAAEARNLASGEGAKLLEELKDKIEHATESALGKLKHGLTLEELQDFQRHYAAVASYVRDDLRDHLPRKAHAKLVKKFDHAVAFIDTRLQHNLAPQALASLKDHFLELVEDSIHHLKKALDPEEFRQIKRELWQRAVEASGMVKDELKNTIESAQNLSPAFKRLILLHEGINPASQARLPAGSSPASATFPASPTTPISPATPTSTARDSPILVTSQPTRAEPATAARALAPGEPVDPFDPARGIIPQAISQMNRLLLADQSLLHPDVPTTVDGAFESKGSLVTTSGHPLDYEIKLKFSQPLGDAAK